MTDVKALVTGATGLIGRHLVQRLHEPRVLARDPGGATRQLGVKDTIAWNAEQAIPEGALDGVDVVFHLAGDPIAGGRLTAAKKERVRDSRVLGTRNVVAAIQQAPRKPRVLVCASAIGFYGSRGDEELYEESAPGTGFLANLCRDWEKEALEASALGVRVVCARTGIVLAREGGALSSMQPAFQLGLGGPLGSGKQWMSWIHVDDVVGLLLHAAWRAEVLGPLNVCAPHPSRNSDFSHALGRAMHRPAWLRTPGVALRMALGEMADVVMASQRVIPAKAAATGYVFRFGTLEEAFQDLLGSGRAAVHSAKVHP
jgi:uncharacterized protein (TIGR01777 family)